MRCLASFWARGRSQEIKLFASHIIIFFFGKRPRSRCYGRTLALRLIVQPCDEDDQCFSVFPCNGAPVE
jgi:hypothetical protein